MSEWIVAAQRAAQGDRLERSAVLTLADALADVLEMLLAYARQVRSRRSGSLIIFSPNLFIPHTNLCRDSIGRRARPLYGDGPAKRPRRNPCSLPAPAARERPARKAGLPRREQLLRPVLLEV
jgi:hypothetical protein